MQVTPHSRECGGVRAVVKPQRIVPLSSIALGHERTNPTPNLRCAHQKDSLHAVLPLKPTRPAKMPRAWPGGDKGNKIERHACDRLEGALSEKNRLEWPINTKSRTSATSGTDIERHQQNGVAAATCPRALALRPAPGTGTVCAMLARPPQTKDSRPALLHRGGMPWRARRTALFGGQYANVIGASA